MPEIILVAEDDPQIAELVRLVLAAKEYDVQWAHDGEEALRLAAHLKPDLILLDVMMPKLNGFEVLHLLKESHELKGIPVIFLTARDQTEDKVTALRMGAHDYMTKPFDIYELIARVEAALRIKTIPNFLRLTDRRALDFSLADPLTGVYNQNYFLERLDEELARARRHQYPLSCLLLDIDDFHTINAKYSRLYGDQALQRLGILLKRSNRLVDVIGRSREDRFAIILTQTDQGGAWEVGERLRLLISRSRLLSHDRHCHITVSIGLACVNGDLAVTKESFMESVEAGLKQAKVAGKNRVSLAPAN